MRARELKKKLIYIIYSNYTYEGNPYACDQQAEQEHDGKMTVCDELLELLDMTWHEVKAAYKQQNERDV